MSAYQLGGVPLPLSFFKARSKTAKDKVDKIDKTKSLELLAKEVARIGLLAIPTI